MSLILWTVLLDVLFAVAALLAFARYRRRRARQLRDNPDDKL